MTTPEQFQALLASPEGSRVEFKSAAGGFHFEDLVKCCVALANESGGKIVLGVTDKRPRQIVRTRAFEEPGRTEAGLYDQLHQRLAIEEYLHDGARVAIVHVRARPDSGNYLRQCENTQFTRKSAYMLSTGKPRNPIPVNALYCDRFARLIAFFSTAPSAIQPHQKRFGSINDPVRDLGLARLRRQAFWCKSGAKWTLNSCGVKRPCL